MAAGDGETEDLLRDERETEPWKRRVLQSSKVPWGALLLEKCGLCNCCALSSHKALVFILTFISYTSYHLSKKPFSVVKVVLCPECANASNGSNTTGWPPFNRGDGNTLLGSLDYTSLFAYAVAMFISGWIADRVNLRYFLTVGMIGSGISVGLLGVAYFAKIQHLWYFILIQFFVGVLQSTGWPGVVAVMTTWFGIHNRGLIMGIWFMNVSVGNILGTVIPSFWAYVDEGNPENMAPWGWAFIVPGLIIATVGIVVFLFLVSDPYYVGLPRPIHQLDEDLKPESYTENPHHGPEQGRRETTEASPLRNGGVTRNGDVAGNGDVTRNGEKEEAHFYSSLSRSQINTSQPPPNVAVSAQPSKSMAVGFFKALLIPGVIEFSLALFFNKLVSYTFLYWLPLYVKSANSDFSAKFSDWLSTLFDVGGIIGGIAAGFISDRLNARAVTCAFMLLVAVPSLFILRQFGSTHIAVCIVLLIVCGAFVNGPCAIINSAVSSDLGTHKSLRGDQNAKATVTAIIDGTGSLGAAFGPLLIGFITDRHHTVSQKSWNIAFYVLMASCFLSAVFLTRLVYTECKRLCRRIRRGSYDHL